MEHKTKKTFVVLGMHRSGTSLVAKGLSNEISMGDDLLPAASDNPKGFFEDKRFVDLNDKILQFAGGNWLEPPSREKILMCYLNFKNEIQDLIESNNAKHEFWGWKDPRTVLTIELFHNHLTSPHYVSVFRNPNEVAKSLSERNGISIHKSLKCAYDYNQRLLQFLYRVGN